MDEWRERGRQMDTNTTKRTAPAFTSSDALLFNYIRKVELRLMRLERQVTMPTPRRQRAKARPRRRARPPSRRDRRSALSLQTPPKWPPQTPPTPGPKGRASDPNRSPPPPQTSPAP